MSDIVKYRCPHLGLEDDAATWFAFPAEENHCHQRRSPRAVETAYQQDFCLSDTYAECPLLLSQKQTKKITPTPAGDDVAVAGADLESPEPTDIDLAGTDLVSMDLAGTDSEEPLRPRRRLTGCVWGVLIIAAISGVLAIFGGSVWGYFAPAPEAPTSTATLLPSETPTATLEPTPAPTLTQPPTATAEPTQEATMAASVEPSPAATEPMRLTLAFDSYVRAGPGRDFATVAYLNAGASLIVLGRDLDGFWLWVRLDDGKEGWVAITQFSPDMVNIEVIPIAPEIPTPEVTATP